MERNKKREVVFSNDVHLCTYMFICFVCVHKDNVRDAVHVLKRQHMHLNSNRPMATGHCDPHSPNNSDRVRYGSCKKSTVVVKGQ